MRPGPRLLILALLAAAGPLSADIDAATFESRLERAERLNVTEPWPESQAILDELRPHLEVADDEQYARFMLLEIRNLGLAGRVDAALDRLERLLERDMPAERRLRAYGLGANLGQVARRYPATFRYLNEALEMLGDGSLSEYDIYALAASMFGMVGEREQAIEYGQLALDLARQIGPRDECIARLRFGLAYRELEEYEMSRRQYEQALDPCRASGDSLLFYSVQYRLADLLRIDGRYERASELFERALEGMRRVGYRFGMAEARLLYARLEAELGRSSRVKELLRPAMDDLARDANWQYIAEAHRLLAEAARLDGDEATALDHIDRHLAARERREQLLRNRQTAFLEVQFDTRHTRQQLELLREKARVEELEEVNRLQVSRMRIGLYTLLVVLVAVLLLLLFRATRDRRRFESLSQRDALTALSNHTRFFELAERTLLLSREKHIPYTLVLADIDHFKQINDRHGHVAGDQILRRVAARLREHFSDKGIIGRIGGEEFGIALPGMRPAEATLRLNGLRKSLAELRRDGDPVDVTLSFGVAAARDHESLTEIRERADEALYRAKDAGRDCVVNAEDE